MVMRCCVNFPMMKFSNLKKKTMMKNKKDRFTILSGISGIAFLFLITGVAIPSSAFSGSNSSASYLVHIPVVSYLPGRGGIPSTATTLVSHSYSSSLFSSDKVVVLAGNQSGAEDMAVSGGYVYWYDFGSGQLNRVSESGGPVTTLLTVQTTITLRSMDWTQAMASSIGVLEIFRAILRIFTRLMGPLVLRRFFTARAGSLELSESPSLASTCISFQNLTSTKSR